MLGHACFAGACSSFFIQTGQSVNRHALQSCKSHFDLAAWPAAQKSSGPIPSPFAHAGQYNISTVQTVHTASSVASAACLSTFTAKCAPLLLHQR